ncbi:hypothetical protein H4R34_004541 [Dimargaris verticillata]|uniref:Mid2 domain-containing protein n=1 Tax=Dimargaris verticillata TaxID=2761393 RepID=A0A9W8B2D5_9FUNG|nr:hypothetical protein H4R34_004541 [Dimargaris verticillata]
MLLTRVALCTLLGTTGVLAARHAQADWSSDFLDTYNIIDLRPRQEHVHPPEPSVNVSSVAEPTPLVNTGTLPLQQFFQNVENGPNVAITTTADVPAPSELTDGNPSNDGPIQHVNLLQKNVVAEEDLGPLVEESSTPAAVSAGPTEVVSSQPAGQPSNSKQQNLAQIGDPELSVAEPSPSPTPPQGITGTELGNTQKHKQLAAVPNQAENLALDVTSESTAPAPTATQTELPKGIGNTQIPNQLAVVPKPEENTSSTTPTTEPSNVGQKDEVDPFFNNGNKKTTTDDTAPTQNNGNGHHPPLVSLIPPQESGSNDSSVSQSTSDDSQPPAPTSTDAPVTPPSPTTTETPPSPTTTETPPSPTTTETLPSPTTTNVPPPTSSDVPPPVTTDSPLESTSSGVVVPPNPSSSPDSSSSDSNQSQTGGETSNPTNTGGETPNPTNTDGETSNPTNTGGETPNPTNTDGETSNPTNTGGETPNPTNTGGETSNPTNTGGETSNPTNTGGETPNPTNTGGETSNPTNTGGETSNPTNTASNPPPPENTTPTDSGTPTTPEVTGPAFTETNTVDDAMTFLPSSIDESILFATPTTLEDPLPTNVPQVIVGNADLPDSIHFRITLEGVSFKMLLQNNDISYQLIRDYPGEFCNGIQLDDSSRVVILNLYPASAFAHSGSRNKGNDRRVVFQMAIAPDKRLGGYEKEFKDTLTRFINLFTNSQSSFYQSGTINPRMDYRSLVFESPIDLTSSDDPTAPNSPASPSSPGTNRNLGIGLGVSLGALAYIVGFAAYVRYRRKKRMEQLQQNFETI